jgi:Fur family peroxide stress response transcriptional regulator
MKTRTVTNNAGCLMATTARSPNQMIEAFRTTGRRMTPQRRAILSYLAGRTDHPSARKIYRTLSPREPSLSLATVYNTLAVLVDLGLVREIEFEAVDNRYDTNLAPHLNLVCVRCGSILDFEHGLPVSPDTIQAELGFEVVDVRLEYRGFCAACTAAASG